MPLVSGPKIGDEKIGKELRALSLKTPLTIGTIALSGPVLLAPMSGSTDLPFRKLARRHGAALAVSEMVASAEYASGETEGALRAKGDTEAWPHGVQLAGCQAFWMGEAARKAEAEGAHFIDINMGCPAKRVTGGYAGSALMRDLDHALGLIRATVAAVKIPVTLKMRLGWDHASLNAPELARRAEAAGVKLIAVHGRTRCQYYDGLADWSAVARTVEAVSIPVVVNGDIGSTAEARDALARSGAAGVMVGRAALGRPWLLGRIAAELEGDIWRGPDFDTRWDALAEQFDGCLTLYGERRGRLMIRKHLAAFLEAESAPRELARAVCSADRPAEALGLFAVARSVCRGGEAAAA